MFELQGVSLYMLVYFKMIGVLCPEARDDEREWVGIINNGHENPH